MIAGAMLIGIAGAAQAAEPIVGHWRVENGGIVEIAPCGKAFCTTVRTGPYKGKRIGRMTGTGNAYSGEITDPNNDRTYSGTVAVKGNSLKLTGCALRIFCRSQTWVRQ
ncbi:DUF2147 domain-containing protein [Jiella sp. M17.18]|uniref:DUF2147 domain-containing protein n=1 Tax=Jiella sp. M17.18 TaxID=3234247 RepID=UPI0034DF1E2C